MARRGVCLVALCVVPLATAGALAQDAPSSARVSRARAAARPVDSSEALGDARAAQREFEQLRRRFLPFAATSSPTSCEERVGRICWWDEDDTTDAVPDEPPAESPRIVAGRDRLLARLDSAAMSIPGDDWIAGQQIHYMIEGGQLADAVERARECAPARWWCDALLGLALHSAGEFAAADSAFSIALAAMPEAERCEWTDLTKLFDGDVRGAYRRLSCDERLAVNERLWWLADPLYSRPGNDRRTEHYSRLTRDQAHRRASAVHRMIWGPDLGELTVRYGWSSHYAQEVPRSFNSAQPSIVAYNRVPGYRFFADAGATPADTADATWNLRPLRSAERYSPLYATFAGLDAQTAAFPRGDSVLVAAAFDAGVDTLFGQGAIESALVLTGGPDRREQAMVTVAGRRGTLSARVPEIPVVASIEVIGEKRIRRARVRVSPRPGAGRRVRLSDVAFFTPGESLPDSFATFVERMRPDQTARREERLGLYWELSASEPITDRLTTRVDVVRERRHWLRRAVERIGIVSPDRGVRLGWDDSMRRDGVVSRAVSVDLSTLDPGVYRIEIVVEIPGEPPLVASRELRVTR